MGMSVLKENIESYDNKYVKDKWFFIPSTDIHYLHATCLIHNYGR